MCDKKNATWNRNRWQLFLPLPDTDFRDYLDEIEKLAKSAPEIVASIEKDLDVHARKEKKIRLEDKKYFASRTMDLPKLDIRERDLLAEKIFADIFLFFTAVLNKHGAMGC